MFSSITFLGRSNITEIYEGHLIEIVWPSDCDESEGLWVDREFIYRPW